jgi:hypothetical protein
MIIDLKARPRARAPDKGFRGLLIERRRPFESSQTRRWRGVDSNFPIRRDGNPLAADRLLISNGMARPFGEFLRRRSA